MVSQTTTPQDSHRTGKGCGTVFFSGFILLGILLSITIGVDLYSVAQTYTWKAHEAVVIESSVIRKKSSSTDEYPYKLQVRYHYIVDGIPYDSRRINFSKPHFSEYDEAEAIARRYPADSTQTIYYNPDIPHESILYHESLQSGVLLVLPVFCLGIGCLGLIVIWWPRGAAESLSRQAVRRSRERSVPRSVLLTSGMLFFFGGIYYTLDAAREIKSLWHIESFTSIPCSILASEVVRHVDTDEDGQSSVSYTPDVYYSCETQGTSIRSNKFRFFKAGQSSYQAVESLIEPYAEGEVVTGWQNPHNPDEVILHKAPGDGVYLALVPFACVLVGLIFFSAGVSPHRGSEEPRRLQQSAVGSLPAEGGMLVSSSTRKGRMIFFLSMSLFWNGIVSVFLYQLYRSIVEGTPALFLGLFLIPFVIIGLVIIVLTIKEFFTLFNPVIRVHVSNMHPRLGETIRLQWHIEGKVSRLSNIVMLLEGEERATYRRGTETTTSTSTFFRKKLLEDLHGRELSRGGCTVTIPLDSMHSFHAMHNEIVWKLIVRGEILRWPDAVDTYTIEVGPAGGADADTGD